jgi:hypothetical protein
MKIEYFQPLPGQDKEWLNSLVLRFEEFSRAFDITLEGETPTGVFVLIDGHACRYKTLRDGSRQISDFNTTSYTFTYLGACDSIQVNEYWG